MLSTREELLGSSTDILIAPDEVYISGVFPELIRVTPSPTTNAQAYLVQGRQKFRIDGVIREGYPLAFRSRCPRTQPAESVNDEPDEPVEEYARAWTLEALEHTDM